MPFAPSSTASLTSELRGSTGAQRASGRNQTTSEAVRAGLRLLTTMDAPQPIRRLGPMGAGVSEEV